MADIITSSDLGVLRLKRLETEGWGGGCSPPRQCNAEELLKKKLFSNFSVANLLKEENPQITRKD